MADVIDSYSEANWNNWTDLNRIFPATGGVAAMGQSFMTPASPAYILDSAKFYLCKSIGSTPDAPLVAVLYAHSGTYGTSSIPTGSPLATSDPVSATVLKDSPQYALITFTFSGANRIELTPSTPYCIVVYGLSGNILYVRCGFDSSSPTHPGNWFYWVNTWNYNANRDSCFYVYGVEAMFGGEFGLGKTSLVMTL